jgi:hypothetical protein
MQKRILLLVLILKLNGSQGQFLGGFFSLKQTELKYYLQQILALKVYAGYLEKGYRIAREGLTTIAEIKNGEFNLHQVFFNSLKTVNPALAKYSKIEEIISCQLSSMRSFKKALRQFGQSISFSSPEISYMNRVYGQLSEETARTLAELTSLLSNGELELTDDQRIKRIDAIYRETKDRYTFIQSFVSDAKLLSAERAHDQNEMDFLKKLY